MDDFTREINSCLHVLKEGGLILYPTDTVWAIGCDATDEAAVTRVFDLKKRPHDKSLSCMVGSDAMLEKFVEQVPEIAWDIMDLVTKPTTVVYDNPRGFAQNLVAPDNSMAIRVARDKFCRYLIGAFKKPLVSTSANISGNPTPRHFGEIPGPILKGVDYVVNLYREKRNSSSSSIIKLGNDGTVKVIRK